jgi:hypothetical protein
LLAVFSDPAKAKKASDDIFVRPYLVGAHWRKYTYGKKRARSRRLRAIEGGLHLNAVREHETAKARR